VTYLSRLAAIGLAKETTQGTYVVPADSIPFTKAQFEDAIDPLRDETIRTNDAVLQGLYQGVWTTTWDIETHAYPDITGHWFRGMVGPDVVTAGVSTTLSASTTAGATSITAAVTIPANSIIQIQDTGGANLEYAKTGTPTGVGPFTIPITTPAAGLSFAHTSPSCTVVSQTTHTFTQNRTNATVWPSYSLTVWDGTDNTRGFPGQVMSELQIKIDPKGIVSFSPKFMGWPSAIQAAFVPAYTAVQPQRGWGWTMSNPGASTRGLTYDVTFKRAVEPVHSSDGTQGPREVFPGAMEADGAYKAIFENTTDYGLFYNYSQGVTTALLTEPVGGQMNAGTSIALTMSKSGYHKFVPDLGQVYIQASFDLSGINNATDAGVTTVVLKNFRTSAY
jgi:hypothetical protein